MVQDEQFVRYMHKRVNEEMRRAANQRLTAEYRMLDDGFDRDKRYIAPLTNYLTYRLQLARLQKKCPETKTRHLVGVHPGNRTGNLHGALPTGVREAPAGPAGGYHADTA